MVDRDREIWKYWHKINNMTLKIIKLWEKRSEKEVQNIYGESSRSNGVSLFRTVTRLKFILRNVTHYYYYSFFFQYQPRAIWKFLRLSWCNCAFPALINHVFVSKRNKEWKAKKRFGFLLLIFFLNTLK